MSTSPNDTGSGPGPLGELPRTSRRHARLARRLRRSGPTLGPLFDELGAMLGALPKADEVDVIPRASGLRRPGAIAQLSWPRLGSRVGLGIEPGLAHAIVDRLLGFDRAEPERKLQVSPVEWGVLGFVVARMLDLLAAVPGPLGPWDLYIDRVGPEPFPPDGLGPIVTLAWPIRVGPASGVVRLWVPEMLVGLALVDEPAPPPIDPDPAQVVRRFGALSVTVRVELGSIDLDRGAPGPAEGDVLPIQTADGPLLGTPELPAGPVVLVLGDADGERREPLAMLADLGPGPEGPKLVLTSLTFPNQGAAEPPAMTPSTDLPVAADTPVSLVVELSRKSLPLARLADLKPGDVLDLGRSADDPVTITSGGTLVAQGTLVQVDEGLGVRITRVFA